MVNLHQEEKQKALPQTSNECMSLQQGSYITRNDKVVGSAYEHQRPLVYSRSQTDGIWCMASLYESYGRLERGMDETKIGTRCSHKGRALHEEKKKRLLDQHE